VFADFMKGKGYREKIGDYHVVNDSGPWS